MSETLDLSIPETAEQLTERWLTEALTHSGVLSGERIIRARQQVLGEGEGFLGDILRLTLSYDSPGSGPASMVAKLPRLANRGMGELLGAYARENMFYMEMATEVPLNTPEMYYGDFDRDKASEKQEEILRFVNGLPRFLNNPMTSLAKWISANKKRRYILLLEDLSDAEPGNQVVGVSPAKAARVLGEVAKAHAAYWNDPELENKFWLLPLDIDARMRHGMYQRSQAAFANMFSTELDSGLRRYTERVGHEGTSMMEELCHAPTTLLHCDLRLDNVFFRDGEVVFFDWQLVRRGPAAYDVAYFLSGALEVDVSGEQIDELLVAYHRELTNNGVAGYEVHDFKRDYRLALHSVLYSLATIDQVDIGEGRGLELIRGWIRRLQARLVATELSD